MAKDKKKPDLGEAENKAQAQAVSGSSEKPNTQPEAPAKEVVEEKEKPEPEVEAAPEKDDAPAAEEEKAPSDYDRILAMIHKAQGGK